jgi:hypothetical protein
MNEREALREVGINEWLADEGRTQQWLAESLGKSRQYISKIARGAEASPDVAFAIEDLSRGKIKARTLMLRGRDPLANFQPVEVPEDPEPEDDGPPVEREQVGVRLPHALMERARNVIWFHAGGLTLTQLMARGLELVLQHYEEPPRVIVHPRSGEIIKKPANTPYPLRAGKIPTGRPMGGS